MSRQVNVVMEHAAAAEPFFDLPYRSFSEQVRALRAQLDLTQEEFAQRFGIPVANLRNWEQAARGTRPDTAARLLIAMIREDAEGVATLIHKVSEKTAREKGSENNKATETIVRKESAA